jgi:urease accessory protein
MERAIRIAPHGHWPRTSARGSVTLDYDARHRRRFRLVSDDGEEFLLDLPRATVLEDGDGLALSDGGWIGVKAAPERLLEITAASAHLLLRLAWHLGNRHLPAEITEERILIREDHVIADMLQGLGATLRTIEAPFTPERGAYDGAPAHGHDGHDHHHDHEHEHDHEHGHHHHHDGHGHRHD